jgi:hypothetical protein
MATPRVNRPHRKPGPGLKPLRATLEQVETLAGLGLTEDEIAPYLGICRKTLAKRKKRSPAFAEAMLRGKIRADTTVVKSLYTKATDQGDTIAMIFWLKNRRPDKWRDKHDIEFPQGVLINVISAIPRPERGER